jgi:hypothetical protein
MYHTFAKQLPNQAQNNEDNMTATGYSTEEIRLGLKKFRGSMKELAQKCGKTREWVRLVLCGKYFDAQLLEAAAILWDQKEEELKGHCQKINGIMTARTAT